MPGHTQLSTQERNHQILHLPFPNKEKISSWETKSGASDNMTELEYSPLMEMHHQSVHISLGKQHLCLGFSNKEKKSSRDGKGTRNKGKIWEMQLVQVSNWYLYFTSSI